MVELGTYVARAHRRPDDGRLGGADVITEVIFGDVRLPTGHRLDGKGTGFKITTRTLDLPGLS